MTFWLKTPNNIYKNWLNSHIDRIMFTVSKLENKNGTIQVEHPVCFSLATQTHSPPQTIQFYKFLGHTEMKDLRVCILELMQMAIYSQKTVTLNKKDTIYQNIQS